MVLLGRTVALFLVFFKEISILSSIVAISVYILWHQLLCLFFHYWFWVFFFLLCLAKVLSIYLFKYWFPFLFFYCLFSLYFYSGLCYFLTSSFGRHCSSSLRCKFRIFMRLLMLYRHLFLWALLQLKCWSVLSIFICLKVFLISTLTHWLLNSMLFHLCESSSFLPIIDFLLAKMLGGISIFWSLDRLTL